jgi:glyoxylase-like metal-dependent hydrolase (beta-lactamase superfamily II)
MRHLATLAFLVVPTFAIPAFSQLPEAGTLPEHWPTGGPQCMEMQEYYIHQYNPNFYILRQSGCTDYEKPFLYLIFGADKALLWDTGSRNSRVRESVDRLIERWLKANSRQSIPLVVVHSHRHGDHIAGDAQFAGRPDTVLVKPDLASVKSFFGFQNWPDEVKTLDLGGRVMDIVPIPGHTDDSFALYDRRTALLLTGDTVYPGRLYVTDFPSFQKSLHRLAAFIDGKQVAHVLGNHIEQTRTPFVDYPTGTKYQPDEHELALSAAHIFELDRVLQGMTAPKQVALRDLTIAPRVPR